MQTNGKPAFFYLICSRQVMVAFVFFQIVISVISLGQERKKKKKNKVGFQLVGA